jgi:hypothetical protein
MIRPELQKYEKGRFRPTEKELEKAKKGEEQEEIKEKVEEAKIEKRGGTIKMETPQEKGKVIELKEKMEQATERKGLESQEKEQSEGVKGKEPEDKWREYKEKEEKEFQEKLEAARGKKDAAYEQEERKAA